MLSDYKLTLPAQTMETADPAARKVLDKALAQVGFIPNMYAVMVNSPGLLNTYLDGYAAFRNDSGFTPPEQETVLLTISRENGCEYCVSAHSMIAEKMSGVAPEVLAAIRAGATIPDAKLAALADFTQIMVVNRGLPSRTQVAEFLDAGFEERHILEIVLAIAVKTLSNYANHLFHTPLDEAFEGHRWEDPRA